MEISDSSALHKSHNTSGRADLTTRPELDHYCRACHHLTRSIGVGQCQWCHSGNIGLHRESHAEKANKIYRERRRPLYSTDSEREQPDVYQQIHYAEKFRLLKGFAILRGGEL